MFEPNYSLLDRFVAPEEFIVDERIRVECDTLDNVLATSGIEDVDFIKLDTQGSELLILKGAENTLFTRGVFGIFIELEFSPMYENQPLFAEVDTFLRSRGFTLFDIKVPLGRRVRHTVQNVASKGQVLWVHALYLKTIEQSCLKGFSLKKAIKTIAIAELNGFSDVALELLDFYHENSIVDKSLYAEVRNLLLMNRDSSGTAKLSTEVQLIRRVRYALVEYLSGRCPNLYGLLRRVRNMTSGQ